MKLRQNINGFIRLGEQKGYVAECLEIPVVTQGETLDEVARDIKISKSTTFLAVKKIRRYLNEVIQNPYDEKE